MPSSKLFFWPPPLPFAAFKKMFDANKETLTDSSALLSDIEMRELDLRKEQRKFYDQRQALTRVVNA